jgi:hypothetical protein
MRIGMPFAGVAAVVLLAGMVSTGTQALAATTSSAAAPAQSLMVQHHGSTAPGDQIGVGGQLGFGRGGYGSARGHGDGYGSGRDGYGYGHGYGHHPGHRGWWR